jgi:hypothetical protein
MSTRDKVFYSVMAILAIIFVISVILLGKYEDTKCLKNIAKNYCESINLTYYSYSGGDYFTCSGGEYNERKDGRYYYEFRYLDYEEDSCMHPIINWSKHD